jgi:hypothetical protein
VTVKVGPDEPGPGSRRRRLRRPRPPHGGPTRTVPRTPQAARAYADKK